MTVWLFMALPVSKTMNLKPIPLDNVYGLCILLWNMKDIQPKEMLDLAAFVLLLTSTAVQVILLSALYDEIEINSKPSDGDFLAPYVVASSLFVFYLFMVSGAKTGWITSLACSLAACQEDWGETTEESAAGVRKYDRMPSRWAVILLCVIPEFLIWCFHVYVGTIFLTKSQRYENLILNSVGILFISEVDELVFQATCPKFISDNWEKFLVDKFWELPDGAATAKEAGNLTELIFVTELFVVVPAILGTSIAVSALYILTCWFR